MRRGSCASSRKGLGEHGSYVKVSRSQISALLLVEFRRVLQHRARKLHLESFSVVRECYEIQRCFSWASSPVGSSIFSPLAKRYAVFGPRRLPPAYASADQLVWTCRSPNSAVRSGYRLTSKVGDRVGGAEIWVSGTWSGSEQPISIKHRLIDPTNFVDLCTLPPKISPRNVQY